MENKLLNEELQENLKIMFKFESFKSKHQHFATISVMLQMITKGSDILISLPPGAGKSICFQYPTMFHLGKITIVIVPDEYTGEEQINFLAEHQIKSFFVHPQTYQMDVSEFFEEVVEKMHLKFLYVTANMLTTNWFQMLVKEMNALDLILTIVIDDAHCISEYYGEPIESYREIYKLRDVFPQIPFIALTSIGTNTIMKDIVEYLQLRDPLKINKSNWRLPKVYLQVRFKDILANPFNDIKCLLKNFMDTSETFSGIIFCSNCNEVNEVTQQLKLLGVSVAAYCLELDEHQRYRNEQDWIAGKITMLVATYQFGIKLVKPSIRCIIHWTIPSNMEQYYRLIGRYTRYDEAILCRLYVGMRDRLNFHMNAFKKPDLVFREYIKMMEYCMTIGCRHSLCSRYFGSKAYPCNNACDSCERGSAVKKRQSMFLDFIDYQDYSLSGIRHVPSVKVYKINQTYRVKNLTSLERHNYYEKLKQVLYENYENAHMIKLRLVVEDLYDFARRLELLNLCTSYEQEDYCKKMIKLITEIEDSTESKILSNYIINYSWIL